MRFVGIDPAAGKPLALVSIGETDEGAIYVQSAVAPFQGARRLMQLREWVFAHTPADTCCALVEVQRGQVLPAVAAVCMEAVQARAAGAVVLELNPKQWRKVLFGTGAASKVEALRIADLWGLGGEGDDVAEALCMALVARGKWQGTVAA